MARSQDHSRDTVKGFAYENLFVMNHNVMYHKQTINNIFIAFTNCHYHLKVRAQFKNNNKNTFIQKLYIINLFTVTFD